MKLLAFLSTLLISTGCASQIREDFVSYNDLFDQANSSNNKMESFTITNNPDYDFSLLMVEHLRAEVEISKNQLKAGHHSEMKNLAKDIINNQGNEIIKIENLVEKFKNSGIPKNENFGKSIMEIMKSSSHDLSHTKMMMNTVCKVSMEMGVRYASRGRGPATYYEKYNCDMGVDYGFGVIMSIHHQEAIDLAKTAMNYLNDSDLKQFAQEIIDVHQAELNTLDKWLNTNESFERKLK